MIAVDTNILVYARRQELPLHPKALKALRAKAEGNEPWGIPVFCIGEFLRVVTHPKVFDPPTSLSAALEAIAIILESPSVRILSPGEQFIEFLTQICMEGKAEGNLIFDAQIVAVLRENGVDTLLTEDRDFLRFSHLQVITLS